MAHVELSENQLIVQIEAPDRLWTFKSRLEIPLAQVTAAEADPEAVRGRKWWRGPGAHIGVIAAGTFHHDGDRVFWDVHGADKAVAVHLTDDRDARLVIGVDHPAGTVAAIRHAWIQGAQSNSVWASPLPSRGELGARAVRTKRARLTQGQPTTL